MKAQRTVTLAIIGTSVIVVVAQARKGSLPTSRQVIGLAIVSMFLAASADAEPRVAVPFSALVFTGTLLVEGGPALGGLNRLVTGSGPVTGPDTGGASFTGAAGAIVGHEGTAGRGLVLVPQRYWAPGASQIRVRADIAPMALSVADKFGLVITSGFRTGTQNASLSDSAPNSLHLCGAACDYVDRGGGLQHTEAAYAWALKQHFTEVEPWSASRDHLHIGFARCN